MSLTHPRRRRLVAIGATLTLALATSIAASERSETSTILWTDKSRGIPYFATQDAVASASAAKGYAGLDESAEKATRIAMPIPTVHGLVGKHSSIRGTSSTARTRWR